MTGKRARILVVGAVLPLLWMASPAKAYVRILSPGGVPVQRTDFLNISYLLDDRTAPGLRNQDGGLIITPESSPVAAVEAALSSWNAISTSQLRFAPIAGTTGLELLRDGQLLISFADTPANRSITEGAVAVTVLFSNFAGDLTDTDIVFNPESRFSTTLDESAFDIQATLTHELGHAIGLAHSGLVTATMFAVTSRGSNIGTSLSADERAFATDVYPRAGSAALFGELTGDVRLTNGQAVRGALVTAVDPSTNTMVGGLTNILGSYRIGQVPPGNYLVYAEPLDGPVEIAQLGRAGNGANVTFRTDFFGGQAAPQSVALSAGGSGHADITVANGLPAFNIEGGAAVRLGQPFRSYVGGIVEPGGAYAVAVFGRGMDNPAIAEESISFLGAKVNLVAGSLVQDTIEFTDGSEFPVLAVLITTDPSIASGMVSVRITLDSETVIFSGGLQVRETVPKPLLSANDVVSAASFLRRPVSPGEIVAIFGEHLGPAVDTAAGANALTGRPNTMAADVAVTMNGIPAPLFFVSSRQINAQAPFEIAGGANAGVVVRYKQIASDVATIPLADVNPGIFTFPFSNSGIVVNQPSGTVNSAVNPAPRGSTVTIFGTGQGAVTPALETGELAGGTGSLSGASGQTAVMIGGVAAAVSFSGMAPGFAGLWQINVAVPPESPPGPAVPISVTIDGVSSQPGVTLAIQ